MYSESRDKDTYELVIQIGALSGEATSMILGLDSHHNVSRLPIWTLVGFAFKHQIRAFRQPAINVHSKVFVDLKHLAASAFGASLFSVLSGTTTVLAGLLHLSEHACA